MALLIAIRSDFVEKTRENFFWGVFVVVLFGIIYVGLNSHVAFG